MLGVDKRTPIEQLFELGTFLLELCVTARNDGLLAIEQKIGEYHNNFLNYSIGILLDANDRADMIIRNKLKYGGYPSSMFIFNSMIADVISVLMTDCNPFIIRHIILSYFTDKQAERFISINPLFFPTYETFLVSIKGKIYLSRRTTLLEKFLEPQNSLIFKEKIGGLLAYDNLEYVASALKGSSEDVIKLFINSLPCKINEQLMLNYNISSDYELSIIENQIKLIGQFNI